MACILHQFVDGLKVIDGVTSQSHNIVIIVCRLFARAAKRELGGGGADDWQWFQCDGSLARRFHVTREQY